MARTSNAGLPTIAEIGPVLQVLALHAYDEEVEDAYGDYRLESNVTGAVYPRLVVDSQGIEVSGTTRELRPDRQSALADGETIVNALLGEGQWVELEAPKIAIHAAQLQHSESDSSVIWFAAFEAHLVQPSSEGDSNANYPFEVAG